MALDQALAGKLVIGVHDGCPVDSQLARQGALGRETYSLGKLAREDGFA